MRSRESKPAACQHQPLCSVQAVSMHSRYMCSDSAEQGFGHKHSFGFVWKNKTKQTKRETNKQKNPTKPNQTKKPRTNPNNNKNPPHPKYAAEGIRNLLVLTFAPNSSFAWLLLLPEWGGTVQTSPAVLLAAFNTFLHGESLIAVTHNSSLYLFTPLPAAAKAEPAVPLPLWASFFLG